MKTRFNFQFLYSVLNFFLLSLYPIPYIPRPASHTLRKGQTTVEFLLMLALVVGLAVILSLLFYKKILGAFFTLVGMILGAGAPK